MVFPLDYGELFALEPYGLPQPEKDALHGRWLTALQAHHAARCEPYARLVASLGDGAAVPVRLFKELDLRSVGEGEVAKTMTSSGTTSQARSRIYLDRETSARQSKALARIAADLLGTPRRVPMLVADAPGTVGDRNMFSARTAGVRGFSMLGRDVTYALRDDMSLDLGAVESFAGRHAGERCMVFGFTFMVWSCLVLPMLEAGASVPLEGALVHGGGWKKLADRAVSPDEFKAGCRRALGASLRVADYYGMVEQTGSISVECEFGHLHASVFGDVEVVDPLTLEPLGVGRRGLIKSVSLLPTSYPGHVLLTEDEGEVLGVDDCPCGRRGRYFKVCGRQRGAEMRGCSDTYERK